MLPPNGSPQDGHSGSCRLDLVIPAAGEGRRMQLGHNKIFATLAGEPVIFHTLRALQLTGMFRRILLVMSPDDDPAASQISHRFPDVMFTPGGATRAESVRNGIRALDRIGLPDFVFVHDAVRPFVTARLCRALLHSAGETGAAVPACAPAETVRLRRGEKVVCLNRNDVLLMQTPQVISGELAKHCFITHGSDVLELTDEMAVLEKHGVPFGIVPGDRQNIKLTVPSDLLLAEALLQQTRL